MAARAAPVSRSSTARSITSAPISALRAAGVPWRTIRPWSMIATRSASSSASSRYWVVRKMVAPNRSRSSRMRSQIRARDSGSRPVVGSSRNSTRGRCSSAEARSRRRFMPPEKVWMRRSMASVRPTSSVTSVTWPVRTEPFRP